MPAPLRTTDWVGAFAGSDKVKLIVDVPPRSLGQLRIREPGDNQPSRYSPSVKAAIRARAAGSQRLVPADLEMRRASWSCAAAAYSSISTGPVTGAPFVVTVPSAAIAARGASKESIGLAPWSNARCSIDGFQKRCVEATGGLMPAVASIVAGPSRAWSTQLGSARQERRA